MILTRDDILRCLHSGEITISPLNLNQVGTNSVDLHLAPTLFVVSASTVVDAKKPTEYTEVVITQQGYTLMPGNLYLACTLERTYTPKHVPIMHGKSSIARLGISIHDAGFGDVGFSGYWTLEIKVDIPTIIYPGMPICQIAFHEVSSIPAFDYNARKQSSYTDAGKECKPQPSGLWKKFS